MSSRHRVVGAADNVDMRGPSDPEPYECDTDERRIISANCCTCEAETTLYLEVGDSEPWEHDVAHPSHMVDYWRDT